MRWPRWRTVDWATWGPALARLLVAVVGLAALVVGLRAAWNSGTGTTALIVGAVLIVLALLIHPDLEQLTARYGGAEVTYRRARREELLGISETLEAVSASDEGEDAQAQLDTMRAELQSLVRQIEQRAEEEASYSRTRFGQSPEALRDIWESRWKGSWSQQGLVRSTTEPFTVPYYSLVRDVQTGTPSISAGGSGFVHDWRIRCTVISPEPHVSSRVFFGEAYGGTFNWHARYPNDFPSAPPLVAGEYEFRWSRIGDAAQEAPTTVDRVTVDRDFLAGRADSPQRLEPRREIRHE